MPTKFVFIVHALHPIHRSFIGLRSAKFGLAFGQRDGTDIRDVSTLCRFRWKDELFGEVVSIPMLPEELLENQDVALERMHRAVKWAERDGQQVDAVGLGSLCSIVAGRGKALQDRVSVPVTTGNAATAWSLYQNCLKANPNGADMTVLGAGSPVGKMVCALLEKHHIRLHVDSRKVKSDNCIIYSDPKEAVKHSEILIGCGPTGPSISIDDIPSEMLVVDVALPHSVEGKRADVTVLLGERMSMPTEWKRGFWGPIYHLISGYGYRTVLACLVEPLVLAAERRETPYAQGRSLQMDDVLAFGKAAEKLGFFPVLSQ